MPTNRKRVTRSKLPIRPLSPSERCRGCLLGGAVGDALGAPVEFMTAAQITSRFGPGGIRDFAAAYGRTGAITDDTQMALFTAEGMIRAYCRYAGRGICHPPSVVHHAYMRWLKTQGEVPKNTFNLGMDGWLIGLQALWSRRAPGNTCLSALRDAENLGVPAANDSKGCGGVMRVAPVGLVGSGESVFELGAATAALTHGHPSGYLSAGFLALLLQQILVDKSLRSSLRVAKKFLLSQPNHEEVYEAVKKAESLAGSRAANLNLAVLGKGWVADEALSIGLYCALAAPTFEEAVVLAVNHSGDSDSTGAITGNICGALYGADAIPARWLEALEVRDEIVTIANDLASVREGTLDTDSESTLTRYPGW